MVKKLQRHDGKNFFVQAIKDNKVAYENIATGQGHDYTTGCLLDYPYFNDSYKMIWGVDLSNRADPRAIQQIHSTENLDRGDANAYTRIFFILEEAKESILDFSQGTVKVL